jgi:hypothetical protein
MIQEVHQDQHVRTRLLIQIQIQLMSGQAHQLD